MQRQQHDWGGLTTIGVDALPAQSRPQLAVILCHGYGASGQDLVPVGEVLLQQQDLIADQVRFYFPAAPLSLAAQGMWDGRAWWHLNLEERIAQIERGEARVLRNEVPAGIVEAATQLNDVLAGVQAEAELPPERIVLGGFSQGAMVATHVALTMENSPAALVLFSGTLICEPVWTAAAPRRAGLRTLITHGRQDPILPFMAAEWLHETLSSAGLNTEFIPFDGQHTIPEVGLAHFHHLLHECLEPNS